MEKRIPIRWLVFAAPCLVLAALACTPVPGRQPPPAPPAPVIVPFRGYLQGLPTGDSQATALCARNHQDVFSTWFCGTHPAITGLDDILVGLGLKDPANPFNMAFAITAHSTSVIGRFTTVLNPRVVVFSPVAFTGPGDGGGGGSTPTTTPSPGPSPVPSMPPTSSGNYVAVGYARGNELVEIAAFDPATSDVNFYLVRYSQACDPNCGNADLFTPATESGWTGVTVYGETDLANTPLDCLQCHEPGGAGTARILRMQERQSPWMHWIVAFLDDPPPGEGGGSGSAPLVQQFSTAHAGETYGGVPPDQIFRSAPFDLELLVETAGFAPQPNEFDSGTISVEGRGPTWKALYANAVAGKAISVPFYKDDPFDPKLVADATKRYLAVTRNGAAPSTMPDMTLLFPTSEYGDLGFQAADSAKDGKTVVQHRCGTCHDGRFPGISRNNFDVSQFPDALPAGMSDKIRTRIHLPQSDAYRMPPTLFSTLTDAQIGLVDQALVGK